VGRALHLIAFVITDPELQVLAERTRALVADTNELLATFKRIRAADERAIAESRRLLQDASDTLRVARTSPAANRDRDDR
jgi:hypothetical protein